jgi:hypothetical protein
LQIDAERIAVREMKIATFNINNINKRLGNLLDWLGTSAPGLLHQVWLCLYHCWND